MTATATDPGRRHIWDISCAGTVLVRTIGRKREPSAIGHSERHETPVAQTRPALGCTEPIYLFPQGITGDAIAAARSTHAYRNPFVPAVSPRSTKPHSLDDAILYARFPAARNPIPGADITNGIRISSYRQFKCAAAHEYCRNSAFAQFGSCASLLRGAHIGSRNGHCRARVETIAAPPGAITPGSVVQPSSTVRADSASRAGRSDSSVTSISCSPITPARKRAATPSAMAASRHSAKAW